MGSTRRRERRRREPGARAPRPEYIVDTAPADLNRWGRFGLERFPRLAAVVRAHYHIESVVDDAVVYASNRGASGVAVSAMAVSDPGDSGPRGAKMQCPPGTDDAAPSAFRVTRSTTARWHDRCVGPSHAMSSARTPY